VACLSLEAGPSIYLWSDGRTYYRGAATEVQRNAVTAWIAALLK
jgi:hypothetical protein